GVLQQDRVANTFRDDAKSIDERAKPRGGADADRTCKPRRAATVQVSADVREPGDRDFGGWCVAAHSRMRCKEQRNSAGTIVKIGPQTNELEHLRVAKPFESDPRRAAVAADRILRQLSRDLAGFGLEHCLVRGGR